MPTPEKDTSSHTVAPRFFDAFAGIGGFHIALESVGARCVAACEIDKRARETYEHNFKGSSPTLFKSGLFFEDIAGVNPEQLPSFDILTAGWPCQPFSQAGRRRGFNESRGILFYEIVRLMDAKKPRAFFLENVQHLQTHDGGRTFATIRRILTEELGYSFYSKVFKASDFGLPQRRPRVYLVGFRDQSLRFEFPKPIGKLLYTMSDVLGGSCPKEIGYTLRVGGKGSPLLDRRNWDGYLVDGVEKRLGPKEALMMQGFPGWFSFPEKVSNSSRMKQLGNSVAVPTIRAIGKSILEILVPKS